MTKYADFVGYNSLMEIIYLDLHFFLNLLADYLVLLSAARVCGLRLKRLRYLSSSLLGAVYSVMTLVPEFSFLSGFWGKLFFGLAMAFIAFGTEKEPVRCAGVFFGISALFGGLVWAAGGNISLKEFALCFALSYAGIKLFFAGKAILPAKKHVDVELWLSGRKACFMALVDTGNQLLDPISGMSVMVACPHALKGLFGEHDCLLELEAAELIELSSHIPSTKNRFRLLPYKAVGSSGMLAVFRADKMLIDGREEQEMLVAISKNASGDGFEAII